jgi:AcrR family transcriptional regulator
VTGRSDSQRTREALLAAAERLVAAHGVTAVSLRAINAEAGARNVSAAHYHFGSKEAVIAAAIARCMGTIAEERLDALDAVEAAAGGRPPELRAVVEAVVAPFLRLLTGGARGGDPITFLARAGAEPGVVLERHAPPVFWRMIQRLAGLLRSALPALPDRVLLLRVRFLVQQCFVLVTELRRLTDGPDDRSRRREVEVIGIDLVDYLVGGLAAPCRAAEGKPVSRVAASTPRATGTRRAPGAVDRRTPAPRLGGRERS